ncbi:hypothetical protein DVA67_022265 [Solirubrobacter sp. CPCC 204708]|uniref:Uncharacterized protein n=1 Tax=Solirubrobacter deserti TaxID=2282478 RepID=A0ABT4RRW9_9ACTN|nr:hypothetical protein [Solirubrobacter deserti]MBE2318719.1 hypothetical protein [Solirubrobacter deserti]MDA0141309.1 hypothetical protein [Solirubrobacter deserti]
MKASALLNSSGGGDSVTLTRVDEILYVVVRWVPQGWDMDDPPESEITLYRQGLPDALFQLSDDLAAHLHRPLKDLAGEPFVGDYALGARHARIALEFADAPKDFVSTRSKGGGIVSVRWRSNHSSFDLAMRVDITTLDRFARQLADLVT